MSSEQILSTILNGVMALGTLAAVGVAIWSAHREGRARARAEARAEAAETTRDTERKRTDEERAAAEDAASTERHKAQAQQVIGWIERREIGALEGPGGNRNAIWVSTLRVVNHSSAPIFDVEVDVLDGKTKATQNLYRVPVMPAEDTREYQPNEDALPTDPSIFVDFRDLQGAHWRRHQNGYLEELNEYGAPIG